MKAIFVILMCMVLFGCTTAQIGKIDTAVKSSAPEVCNALEAAYQGFIVVGLGSEKVKAQVEAVHDAAKPICANPEKATALQLALVTSKTGIILYNMNKVKANG